MSKIPSLVLDTPLARAVDLLDRHFGFLIPIGVEVEIAGGRPRSLVQRGHHLPSANEVPVFRHTNRGTWSTLRDLLVSRTGRGLSIYMMKLGASPASN